MPASLELPEDVQLVHKEINMMRGSLCTKRFVDLCVQIANKVKW